MAGIKTEKSLIILGVALLAISGCSKKGGVDRLKATVEIVDGVRTVRNPETPRYGEFAFELAEDLAIGDEKDEAYFFPRGGLVNVDDEGTIYFDDFGNRRIQVYDWSGKYVRTLGRRGQGPGEYIFPGNILIDEAGNPHVRDSRALISYDREGTFLKKIQLKTLLMSFMLGPGGTVIGTVQPKDPGEGIPKNELVMLGPDGERLRTLAVYPVYGISKDQALMHWYTGGIAYCRRSEDSLYYGFTQEYTIHVVDTEGCPLLVFSKAEEPVSISTAENDLTRKEGIFAWSGMGDREKADLGMPEHRPFFSNFISDDAGRLYVIRFQTILERDNPTRNIDVFSKDGLYLYRMTWPFLPQVIKGGFLYEVRQDEEAGDTKIVRHKITNWTDFKAE
jgi:hypothetical protein